MKLYLRDEKSRMFYAGPEKWTESFRQAEVFPTVPRAQRRAAKERLRAIELVLVDGGGRTEIVFAAESE